MGADFVQKIPVMGNHDDRVLEINQEILQPADGIQIQVVGRLVEQQDVRITEKSTGQKYLHFVRVRQFAHLFVVKLGVDSQAVQKGSGVGFGFPAVHRREICLQLAGSDAVFIGKIRFGIDFILLLHDVVQSLVSGDDRVQDDLVIVFEVILFQDRQAFALPDGDLSRGGIQFAGQDFQKGGFSGTVGADDTVAVSFRKFYVYFLKKCLFAKAKRNIACLNHGFLLLYIVKNELQLRY